MEKDIGFKEHIGIFISIIISSVAAYNIALYYNEPVNWFLIIVNMMIGFLIHLTITITRFKEENETEIEDRHFK